MNSTADHHDIPRQEIPLAACRSAERTELRRERIGDIAGLVVVGAIAYEAQTNPSIPGALRAPLELLLLLIAVVGVLMLCRATLRRPMSLTLAEEGILLTYANRRARVIPWGSPADPLELREVHGSTVAAALRESSAIWLRDPLPHTFHVPEAGAGAIRAYASQLGIRETSRPYRRLTAGGWVTLGERIRFVSGPGASSHTSRLRKN
jgi:hypothetical protein